jgi:hypothetical protein
MEPPLKLLPMIKLLVSPPILPEDPAPVKASMLGDGVQLNPSDEYARTFDPEKPPTNHLLLFHDRCVGFPSWAEFIVGFRVHSSASGDERV